MRLQVPAMKLGMEPKINPIRGGTMFQMNHDFFDSFPVQFYAKETIVGGEHYPLGHFAVEALAVSGRVFREIDRLQELFQEEFQIFLSARSPQCNSNHIPKIDNEKIPLDVR